MCFGAQDLAHSRTLSLPGLPLLNPLLCSPLCPQALLLCSSHIKSLCCSHPLFAPQPMHPAHHTTMCRNPIPCMMGGTRLLPITSSYTLRFTHQKPKSKSQSKPKSKSKPTSECSMNYPKHSPSLSKSKPTSQHSLPYPKHSSFPLTLSLASTPETLQVALQHPGKLHNVMPKKST